MCPEEDREAQEDGGLAAIEPREHAPALKVCGGWWCVGGWVGVCVNQI